MITEFYLSMKHLESIFKFFGDEKEAKYIARNIIKERVKNKIDELRKESQIQDDTTFFTFVAL